MNVGKLITVYQLINEIEVKKPDNSNLNKKVAFNETLDKLNEVNDQIRYLNYALKKIDSRYLECTESADRAKQKINENRDWLINQIHIYSNSHIAYLGSILETKTSYKNKAKSEIKKMIQIREDLMNKIEKIFKEKYILKDHEKAALLALDYPIFNLELEFFAFRIDQEMVEQSIEQCFGEIYFSSSDRILKICNDEEYKKNQRHSKKLMNKSKSKAEVNSFFEIRVEKTPCPIKKKFKPSSELSFIHSKTPSNVERILDSAQSTPRNLRIKHSSRK